MDFQFPADRLVSPNGLLPTTRYFGSKRKQAPWLLERFLSLPRGKVLDLCGGTATVSLLFKLLGNDVYFYDTFEFNRINARALLECSSAHMNLEALRSYVSDVKPIKGFIAKTFDGVFYTTAENRWLDGLMHKLTNEKTLQVKQILFYCIAQACLSKRPFNLFHRANLSLRLNHKTSRFGNFTTWEVPFPEQIVKAYAQLEKAWKITSGTGYVLDTLNGRRKYDIIYIDPPYIKDSAHHESYGLRYHFLEGLANYERWPELIDKKSKTKRIQADHLPLEWTSGDSVLHAVERAANRHPDAIIALSYADNAKPGIPDLLSLLSKQRAKISCHSLPHQYTLSKRRTNDYLLLAE